MPFSWTREQAVALIMRRLGNRTGLEAWIREELKLAQRKYEGFEPLPWFLVASTPMLYSAATVATPADFLKEFDDGLQEGSLLVIDDDGKTQVLEKDDLGHLIEKVATGDIVANGIPRFYALVEKVFHLFPVPDKNYSGTLWYYKEDVLLDTDIENSWLRNSPEILMGEAGGQIARTLRDEVAVTLFERDKVEGIAKLQVQTAARSSASRSLTLGESS